MDDLRHLVGTTGPIPDKKCLRVDEDSEIWQHYNCRCVRHADDGKGDAHTVIAQSTEEMLATLGSGDYSGYNRYQVFILGESFCFIDEGVSFVHSNF